MKFQEGEFVPVAALEDDFALVYLEESAAPEAVGVLPFQDGPFPVGEDVFRDAGHLGGREFPGEHLPYRRPAHYRRVRHLMVDGILGVKGGDFFRIRLVEGVYPEEKGVFRGHRVLHSISD